jgi:hypothetical protein
MNYSETLQARGDVSIVLTGPDGKVKDQREIKNLVVTAGLAHIASRIVGTAQGVMSHMALGSNNVAAAAGNTALGNELGRVALTGAVPTGASIAFTATFGAGSGTGSVTEAGLFNAAAAGTMLARTTFGVVTKESGDTLAITWTVTISV